MEAEVIVKADPVQVGRQELEMPSVLGCGLMIAFVKLLLRTRGFGWTMRWLGFRAKRFVTVAWPDVEGVKATEHAVAVAGALYPGRALCLEQSLVLYYLLRRQGVPVTYRQGIQPYPFEAHAWVEYQGQPINDLAEHVRWFVLLPDQIP